jgi:hypothetical protein
MVIGKGFIYPSSNFGKRQRLDIINLSHWQILNESSNGDKNRLGGRITGT